MIEGRWDDNGVCRTCGHHFRDHDEEGQGRRVCPVLRVEPQGLGGELTPRGDY